MPRKIHRPRHAVDTPAPVRLTCWTVITGAPCSGKTSVIADLARRGFGVVPEAARAHIDTELRKGRPLLAIKSDPRRIESLIFKAKLRIEARLPADEPLFLDRALPDSIAYYLLEGLDPAEPRRQSLRTRYRRVFLFERLDFVKDPVRSEDSRTAARIERLIAAAYRELGYAIVRVPVLPIPARTEFILARLQADA
jgi:predicted ATPase